MSAFQKIFLLKNWLEKKLIWLLVVTIIIGTAWVFYGKKVSADTGTWDFTNSGDYDFNGTYLAVTGGQAQMTDVASDVTKTSATDFSTGTFSNTTTYGTGNDAAIQLSLSSTATSAWFNYSPTSNPSARYGSAVAWDNTNATKYVFGGIASGGTLLNDLWKFNVSTRSWSQITTSGGPPAARDGSSMIWHPTNGKLYLFGGYKDPPAVLNDLWEFNITTSTWTQLSPTGGPPATRYYQSAVWDTANSKILVFGGCDSVVAMTCYNTVWAYNPVANTWAEYSAPTGGPPTARNGHSAVWNTGNNLMYVFGGSADGTSYRNDLWTFDPTGSGTWAEIADTGPPTARDGHIGVWDSLNNDMIVFSGYDGTSYFNEIWNYDIAGNTWTQLSPIGATPTARRFGMGVWDNTTKNMLFFGGWTGASYLSDTQAFIVRETEASGTFTSAAIDFTAATNFTTLSWVEGTPTGTDVKFQLATSADNISWSDFLGSDGTTASFYNTTWSGESIHANSSGYRYLKVRATLLPNENIVMGPMLGSFTIATTRYDTASPTMKPYTYATYGNVITAFSADEGGTGSVRYQVTHQGDDGDPTWYWWDGDSWATVSGATDYNTEADVNTYIDQFYLGLGVGNFAFKAFFISNGLQQVTLDNIVITYSAGTYTTPQQIPESSMPVTNGPVYAIAVSGGITYVGGQFSTIDGIARNGLAAIDANGDVTSFNPDVRYTLGNEDAGIIRDIVVSGSNIYFTGDFGEVGGVARNYAGAVNTSGVLQAWNPNLDNIGFALDKDTDGNILIGGSFISACGDPVDFFASLTPAATCAMNWAPSIDSYVYEIYYDSGTNTVFIGGDFQTVDAETHYGLAALTNLDTNVVGFDALGETGNTIYAIEPYGPALIVGGTFDTIAGGAYNNVAGVLALDGSDIGYNPNLLNGVSLVEVHAIEIINSLVYLGGQFVTISGSTRNKIGSTTVAGALTTWNPNANNNVYVIKRNGLDLWAGGEFTTIGGPSRAYLAYFANPPVPTISSLSPSSATAGDAGFDMTVTGTGFTTGSVVYFAGSARTTTYVSATQLTAAVLAGDVDTAGTFNVTVATPYPGGGTSSPSTFTVNPADNPVPTTTSISPSSKTAGSAEFTLTVNGTNFIASSVVKFDGTSLTTAYVGSTQLTATVPADNIADGGTFSITVFNPTPGGGTSGAQTLTVNNSAPTISAISPTGKTVHTGSFVLTVSGTGFTPSSVIYFDGVAQSTTFINSTTLTATIGNITSAGDFNVYVVNPIPGGGTSSSQTFEGILPSAYTATILELDIIGVPIKTNIGTDNIKTDISSDGSSVNFGNLYWTEGKTAALLLRGTTNIAGGYSIYVS
ncbi:hypothetical protein HYV44_01095, partial [Candidatus Microgenomates bacterium]|nr:hypothetical protein [Candidatus Microgenomates bacterium]